MYVELASLLIVFTAAFLAGQAVAARTANVWWGILAGSLAFLGVAFGLSLLASRFAPAPRNVPLASDPRAGLPPRVAAPGVAEMGGLLALFLVGYTAAHFVAGATRSVWWGAAAGALVVAGIFAALMRLAARAATQPAAATPSPAPAEQELSWLEPRSFRATDMRKSREWLVNMSLLTLGVAVLCLWLTARFAPDAGVTRKLIVTAGGILVFFLGLFGFTRLMRVGVTIDDEGIVQELGDTTLVHPFDTIAHCEIGTMLVGSRMHPVLVAVLRNDDRETFGLPFDMPTDLVLAALQHRGVLVTARTDTMQEEPAS